MAVNAVTVAASILEAVARHGPVGVSQISRITGTPKATAQRMLTTWHELGWVQKETAQPISWSLTGRLLELGSLHNPIADLRRAARLEMEQLSEGVGGETIHLAVRSGTGVTLVDRVEGTKPVRTHYPIGGIGPLYATATGHAHLSILSDDEVRRLFAGKEIESVTPHTITDLSVLLETLRTGRACGYYKVEGTNHAETSAVAAPVVNADGTAAGAISVSLPSSRLTPELSRAYGNAVAATAKAVSEQLAMNVRSIVMDD